jgi:hypothetical protein
MIKQHSDMLIIFRYLTIFVAITLGIMTIVASSSDDASDVVNDFDLGVDANYDLDLAELTVTDDQEDCDNTNIKAELIKAGVPDLVEAGITKIEINDILVSYQADWDPASIASFECTLKISGDSGAVTFTATTINSNTNTSTGFQTINPDANSLSVVEDYLNNREQTLNYCIQCTGVGGITTMDVMYDVRLDVHIEA